MKPNLVVGWSQDQHVNHRRLGITRPLNSLMNLFPDDVIMDDYDILFYGGDFFDHLIENVNDGDLADIIKYMGWRLRQAEKHNYAVRVLRGTISHDRDQNRYWETVYDVIGCKADFKYIDKVCIESHPIAGDILYIPDNWKPTGDEVWEDVVNVMAQEKVEMVDWVIMHGAFKHQLPDHLHGRLPSLHTAERYAKICRKYILVGHVHVKSQYMNVISNGSLDRHSFGEEEPKGVLRIDCSPNGDNLTFIENKDARAMITLEVDDLPIDKVIRLIDKEIKNLNQDYLSLRLVASKTSEVAINLKLLEDRYPFEIVFKDNAVKQKQVHLINISETTNINVTHDLSIDGIRKLWCGKLGDKVNADITAKMDVLLSGVK